MGVTGPVGKGFCLPWKFGGSGRLPVLIPTGRLGTSARAAGWVSPGFGWVCGGFAVGSVGGVNPGAVL